MVLLDLSRPGGASASQTCPATVSSYAEASESGNDAGQSCGLWPIRPIEVDETAGMESVEEMGYHLVLSSIKSVGCGGSGNEEGCDV